MINICCVKWGTKFDASYVNKLYHAVRRNTTVEFKFHCFTDDTRDLDLAIVAQPLPNSGLEGWWNKVYLFSNEIDIPVGEKIVFIDLDTLITRNIDHIVGLEPAPLIALRDFLTGIISSIQATDNHMGSGLMIWQHGQLSHVWDQFVQDPYAAIHSVYPHGDQRWIQAQVPVRQYFQDIVPDQVVSFKVHCLNGLPPNAAVVCYHGQPSVPDSITFRGRVWKFDITPQPWVADHWRV